MLGNVINALNGSYGTPDRHLKAQQVYEVIYYKKVLNDEEFNGSRKLYSGKIRNSTLNKLVIK